MEEKERDGRWKPVGICCACCMHDSDWLGPECKRSGRPVVSIFRDFARLWEYAYEITAGQFLNSEQTSWSYLNSGRKANTVIHRWLFQGGALLILLWKTSVVSCDVVGDRVCICRERVSGCIANICMGLFTCTKCPPWEGLPRSAVMQLDTCTICGVIL